MKNAVYILTKRDDVYELPLGVFETVRDVARYTGYSEGHIYNSLCYGLIEGDYGVCVGDYVVERVVF